MASLIPFINSHSNSNVSFWPDLASCHYSKTVLEELASNNVTYVPKDFNPPNVPPVRLIENFWSILKRKVYANGFVAKNQNHLMNEIEKQLLTFRTDDFRNLMQNLRSKIIKADKNGLPSALC